MIGENEHTATWNTFSPVWVDATTPFDLSENAPVGTTVVTINANDDDAGTDGEITFELGTITPGMYRAQLQVSIVCFAISLQYLEFSLVLFCFILCQNQ